jgi:hypothetical protein
VLVFYLEIFSSIPVYHLAFKSQFFFLIGGGGLGTELREREKKKERERTLSGTWEN